MGCKMPTLTMIKLKLNEYFLKQIIGEAKKKFLGMKSMPVHTS